jgi:hypothetical protein
MLCQYSQSFQDPLPWSECPKEYYENGSYVTNMECKVNGKPTPFRISLVPVSFILQLMVLFVHTEERADPVFLVP